MMANRLTAPRLRGSMTFSGPFFERDPAETFAQNGARMMSALAIEGELDLKARIGAIPPAGVKTGGTRRRVRGRARAAGGKPWRTTAVVGVQRELAGPDPIATYAALHEIESRHAPVRQTATAMRRARAINVGELLRGIA